MFQFCFPCCYECMHNNDEAKTTKQTYLTFLVKSSFYWDMFLQKKDILSNNNKLKNEFISMNKYSISTLEVTKQSKTKLSIKCKQGKWKTQMASCKPNQYYVRYICLYCHFYFRITFIRTLVYFNSSNKKIISTSLPFLIYTELL